ncbi:hypothetical protein MY11210_004171 [Beauveria gryllotalpidicola]
MEKVCGTEAICDLFNPIHGPKNAETSKYGYANSVECYAAREPPPWVLSKDSDACVDAMSSSFLLEDFEDACGTEKFCDIFNPKNPRDEALLQSWARYGFANDTECYAGHGKMPWVEFRPEDYSACMKAVESNASREEFERVCGTEQFCDLFNPEDGPYYVKSLEIYGKYGFKTPTECLAGHSKKPWVEPERVDYAACMKVAYSGASREEFEKACGTEDFCDSFNPKYGAENLEQNTKKYGYATVEECIADHEPKP